MENKTVTHPKSERTIIKNKYHYKGLTYINDIGHPCEYRVIDSEGNEIEMVKYYRGKQLAVYGCTKNSAMYTLHSK